jgi:hypothetical protein
MTTEELDQQLADGEITQEEYDRMLPTASESKSTLDYVDPYQEESPIDATGEDFDMSAPIPEPKEIVSDGLENQKPDTRGNLIYTYDDGSTLTMSPDGEVIDVTESTDTGGLGSLEGTGEDFDMSDTGTGEDFDMSGEYQEEEYAETPYEKSGSGFAVKIGRPGLSRAASIRRGMVKKPTPGANETEKAPPLCACAKPSVAIGKRPSSSLPVDSAINCSIQSDNPGYLDPASVKPRNCSLCVSSRYATSKMNCGSEKI